MPVRNVNGHGVTGILGPHGGQGAMKAPIQFMQTTGPANYTGPNSSPVPGGLPGGRYGGKKSSSPQAPNKSTTRAVKGIR